MERATVAVVGATGLVGREIIAVLEQRQFPLADLRLYASLRSAGESISCGDLSRAVEVLDGANFDDVDIVFLAAGERITAEWISRLEASPAVVIDLSQLFAGDTDVPVVVPEVNAGDLADHSIRGIVASPDPATIALSVVLNPFRDAAGIRRVVVTSIEPASGIGGVGIDELQRQTVDLMQGRGTEPATFPHRIAFNLFPQIGELLAGGNSKDEEVTTASVRRVLDQAELAISITRVRAPLFFGHALSIDIETTEPMVLEEVVDLLRGAPGVLLPETMEGGTYPTPADVVGEDATFVGRIRCDPPASTIDVWAVIDGVRKGAAVNAVQIAELLLRDHL
jgi:aspartate-semialdehyde dehydrogenase